MKAGAIIPQKIVEDSNLPCYVKLYMAESLSSPAKPALQFLRLMNWPNSVVLPDGRPPNPYGIWFLSA